MDTATIFQSAEQNILRDAVITSDQAPRATYPLEVLGYLRPDMRVRWDTGTVTITWTLPVARRGDVLVIPISNLSTSGSPGGSVTLTNDAGLSQVVDMPDVGPSGFPDTLALDLTEGTPDPDDRLSDEWNLVIVGNPLNVTIGGALAIYGPKTQFGDRDFRWGYTRRRQPAVVEVVNEYLTRFAQDTRARVRGCDLETLATNADADALEAFFDGCHGRALPGLLWVVDFEDAYLGLLPDTFERVIVQPDTNLIRLSFTELSKGIPLL